MQHSSATHHQKSSSPSLIHTENSPDEAVGLKIFEAARLDADSYVCYGLYSYGLYRYGLYSSGWMRTPTYVMAYIIMTYIGMAYIGMTYIVLAGCGPLCMYVGLCM